MPLGFQGGILLRFYIVIPDGHSGLTGIALGYGHRAVIPYTAGAYFSGNDEVFAMDWIDSVPGVAWSAFLCNNDLQSHSWEVRFEYNEIGGATDQYVVAPLSATDIYTVADVVETGT